MHAMVRIDDKRTTIQHWISHSKLNADAPVTLMRTCLILFVTLGVLLDTEADHLLIACYSCFSGDIEYYCQLAAMHIPARLRALML